MKRRLRAPSPALVISLVALFVALGGTAYAATTLPANSVGTKQLKKNAVTGAKIKNGAVTASKINTAGLIVPDAQHAKSADSATHATNAAHATSADTAATASAANTANTAATATNALSLGGIPASGYTRSDCNSVTGQVKGFAFVPASTSFSSSLVNLADAYNCSGQAVQARRITFGEYEVKFLGSPVTIAVGNVMTSTIGLTAFITVVELGPGDFEVVVLNPTLPGAEDDAFALITP